MTQNLPNEEKQSFYFCLYLSHFTFSSKQNISKIFVGDRNKHIYLTINKSFYIKQCFSLLKTNWLSSVIFSWVNSQDLEYIINSTIEIWWLKHQSHEGEFASKLGRLRIRPIRGEKQRFPVHSWLTGERSHWNHPASTASANDNEEHISRDM